MAAPDPIRIEVSFDALNASFKELRELHSLTVGDLIIWKHIAQELGDELTRLRGEVEALRSQIEGMTEAPAQPPG